LTLGNADSLRWFLPEIVLVGTILAVLIHDMAAGKREAGVPVSGGRSSSSVVTLLIALIGLALSVCAMAWLGTGRSMLLFGGAIAWDPFSIFFRYFFLLVSAAVLLITHPYKELERFHYGEFVALLLATGLGMMLLASASSLLMAYLALEMVSLPSYILAGWLRRDRQSSEAALKYAVYGAAASGAMLYGFSFLYGMTGSIQFFEIRDALGGLEFAKAQFIVPIVFILAGFGYKIAFAPFHMWAPDVYEGSATPVTAFFSIGPKAAGLAVLIRFFFSVLTGGEGTDMKVLGPVDWPVLLAILSAVTMTLGNLAALRQNNLKRLLAYSSIAHAGFLLMGVVVMSETGVQAVLFYLAVYAIMNLGAFLIVITLSIEGRRETIDHFRGLGWRAPLLGVAMTLFLLSLTGVPPTAGFVGKFYILKAVIEKEIYWLAVVAVLNTLVSLYYYVRIMKVMFLDQPGENDLPLPRFSFVHLAVIVILMIPTALFGFRFGLLDAITAASRSLFLG